MKTEPRSTTATKVILIVLVNRKFPVCVKPKDTDTRNE